jgi:hypothetical protein
MKEIFLIISTFFGFLILMFVVSFVVTDGSIMQYAYFAPKLQAIQRNIYVETPSFVLGNDADLEQTAQAYNESNDPTQKESIKAGLIATVNNLPPDFKVPANVEQIINNGQ